MQEDYLLAKQNETSDAQTQNQTEIAELESTVLSLQNNYEELETTLHEADNDLTALREQTNNYSKLNKDQFNRHKQIGWKIEATELNVTIIQARMEKLEKTL